MWKKIPIELSKSSQGLCNLAPADVKEERRKRPLHSKVSLCTPCLLCCVLAGFAMVAVYAIAGLLFFSGGVGLSRGGALVPSHVDASEVFSLSAQKFEGALDLHTGRVDAAEFMAGRWFSGVGKHRRGRR